MSKAPGTQWLIIALGIEDDGRLFTEPVGFFSSRDKAEGQIEHLLLNMPYEMAQHVEFHITREIVH